MNTNNQQREYVEDAPIMRSMMMAPSAAYTPILPKAAPLAKKAAAHVAPHEAQTTKTSSSWESSMESLMTPVPPIYALERTHVYVPNAKPEQVAQRVSACLQRESIAAFFDDDEAVIDAETMEGIQFSVRFWWGAQRQVLVEVQKASGCCYGYCQAAKAIIRAAKGMEKPLKKRTFSIPPCVPEPTKEDLQEALREGIAIAANLLREDGVDSHVMAMESLAHLSRCPQNPSLAARLILGDDFQSSLVSLIESSCLASVPAGEVSSAGKDSADLMHRLALTAVANSFSSLEAAGELRTFLMENPALCSSSFSSALVKDVAKAAECPHNSCEAVRCLRVLMMHTPDQDKTMAREAVAVAHAEGVRRHSTLEEETRALRRQL